MNKTNIRAGLVGVTGYTGMELARLLAAHPSMHLVTATARTEAGKHLSDIYPFLERLPSADVELIQPEPDLIAKACDIAFLAVPHGAAANMAAELLARGVKVVDLSADFRLHSAATYEQWYQPHPHPELLAEAVYGLPELYAAKVKKARLVANPGCYPTSVILGLAPVLQAGLVDPSEIIIDSKSGTTGAGRKAQVPSLFCEVSDTFRAYGIAGKHRHTPEIEQELSLLAGRELLVSFTPHLVPMNRGILSTIYVRPAKGATLDDLLAAYRAFAARTDTPWLRPLPAGRLPETRNVRGSMFCDVAVALDTRTNRVTIVSVIDNICRGASGQAVANANLMFGLPVAMGLAGAPLLP